MASQRPPPADNQSQRYPIYHSIDTKTLQDKPLRPLSALTLAVPKHGDTSETLHANHVLTDAPSQFQHSLPPQRRKLNRMRKACDPCSTRKIKCDESGPPCRACLALEIPCTFDRPSRRRGPVNRHAEAFKKRRIDEGDLLSDDTLFPSLADAHAQLQSSQRTQLSAEAICPPSTMNTLIDDFFTYIYPLCPFPHEPSFRGAWERREDFSNPSFLALLASMVAALVSSFPRRSRLHLEAHLERRYSSHLSLVDKCREICSQARGPGYLNRPSLNVYDACTSYFLGMTGAYVFQWRQMQLYFAECLNILRSLGYHESKTEHHVSHACTRGAWGLDVPELDECQDPKLDHVIEQLERRVFWAVFTGLRTMQQSGAFFGGLILAPATPSEPFPPLPEAVDDIYISPHEIRAQPPGVIPLMAGFLVNVQIYLSYSILVTAEIAFGVDEIFDWHRQQYMLEQSLLCCRKVLDTIPDVFRIQVKPVQNGDLVSRTGAYHCPNLQLLGAKDHQIKDVASVGLRCTRRYEVQKANIYASHLATRSYLVQKYFLQLNKHRQKGEASLRSSLSVPVAGMNELSSNSTVDADALEMLMSHERKQVVEDLLVVLGSIDMINMEPNADSFASLQMYLRDSDILYVAGQDVALCCTIEYFFRPCDISPVASLRFLPTQTRKIRSIASTLLEMPEEEADRMALQYGEIFHGFLDLLTKFEQIGSETSELMSSFVNEEMELQLLADLRDQQVKLREYDSIYSCTRVNL